jgi:hypothetical protein
MGEPNDFFMRSLWKNIGFMEVSLPQLQKVGDELSATPGDRRFNRARALSIGEVFMT